jgi:hypothetical protein
MFAKHDTEFDEVAADPIRRRAKIADLSTRRAVVFWCAMVIGVAAIVECWEGKGAMGVFAAATAYTICLKMESDLRLLRVIERLQKEGGAKSGA